MSDENIIRPDFTVPRDPSVPDLAVGRRYARTKRSKPRCEHLQVEMDDRTFDVTCVACEAPVNPGVILLRIARKEMTLIWSRAEEAAIRQRLAALKAEERQAKERLRRTRQAEKALRALPTEQP